MLKLNDIQDEKLKRTLVHSLRLGLVSWMDWWANQPDSQGKRSYRVSNIESGWFCVLTNEADICATGYGPTSVEAIFNARMTLESNHTPAEIREAP